MEEKGVSSLQKCVTPPGLTREGGHKRRSPKVLMGHWRDPLIRLPQRKKRAREKKKHVAWLLFPIYLSVGDDLGRGREMGSSAWFSRGLMGIDPGQNHLLWHGKWEYLVVVVVDFFSQALQKMNWVLYYIHRATKVSVIITVVSFAIWDMQFLVDQFTGKTLNFPLKVYKFASICD